MPTPTGPELVVVAPPGAADGFRLAGAHTIEAADGDQATTAVAALLASGSVGLIAISAGLWEAAPPAARQQWRRLSSPLILPVPDEDTDAGAVRDEALRDLLSRAVGYQITFEPEGAQP